LADSAPVIHSASSALSAVLQLLSFPYVLRISLQLEKTSILDLLQLLLQCASIPRGSLGHQSALASSVIVSNVQDTHQVISIPLFSFQTLPK
jgi:hypothetical protein